MPENYQWPLETLTSGDGTKIVYQTLSYNAEIIDFFVNITLTSCQEMPAMQKPEGIELMNEAEISKAWNEATADADKKILTIEYMNSQDKIATATEFIIMRVSPSYTEYLIPYLSANQMIVMGHNCKIRASIKPLNCGVLAGDDKIEFRMIVREFQSKDIDQLATQYLS
ncbi:hypothetical protein [Floridanema aerugineum]|uniref:Uncharacterized protein n=1 Tax=Floridaenema aerugineum BLCC-F46 TaxID=3153654 RepID=A0ABV4XDI8_9CYAN